jgi:microcystin-dependent protein
MALESGTYINSLNASNPASTDGLAQADDHLRLLKATIKSTLPNVTGAITATQSELNVLDGVTASTSEINKLDGLEATTSQLNALAATGGIPSGGIIMWSGSIASIPTGWVLCNGSNGSPDLRNRFVVGAGSSYSPSNTGGADTVSLSTANMPAHNHSFSGSGTTSTAGNHRHGSVANPLTNDNGRDGDAGSNSTGINEYDKFGASTGYAGDHNHTVSISGTTGNTGSGTAHENRPPYYALAYIFKT